MEDIKPDNILLSRLEKPDIRFADFGLAEIFDTRELGTRCRNVICPDLTDTSRFMCLCVSTRI